MRDGPASCLLCERRLLSILQSRFTHARTNLDRKGTIASSFKQVGIVPHRCVGVTQPVQLAREHGFSIPTVNCCACEDLEALARHASDPSTSLEHPLPAGDVHLNVDGTMIRTDHDATAGPRGTIPPDGWLPWALLSQTELRMRHDLRLPILTGLGYWNAWTSLRHGWKCRFTRRELQESPGVASAVAGA